MLAAGDDGRLRSVLVLTATRVGRGEGERKGLEREEEWKELTNPLLYMVVLWSKLLHSPVVFTTLGQYVQGPWPMKKRWLHASIVWPSKGAEGLLARRVKGPETAGRMERTFDGEQLLRSESGPLV